MKKTGSIVLAFLSIIIGLYPGFYYLYSGFGFLKTKPDALVANVFWHTAFYTHITFGGLALLMGWIQFSPKIRTKRVTLHRQIGMAYLIAVLLSALTGFYIAFYSMGGIVATLGFMSLSTVWFYTTLMGYLSILKGKISQHNRMMIYSYASCFAAVTLRLWLPLLSLAIGNFETAYIIVAWWCWVPNLIIAYFINKRTAYARPLTETYT